MARSRIKRKAQVASLLAMRFEIISGTHDFVKRTYNEWLDENVNCEPRQLTVLDVKQFCDNRSCQITIHYKPWEEGDQPFQPWLQPMPV